MLTNYEAITAYSTLGALVAAVLAAIFAGFAWRSQRRALDLTEDQWTQELDRRQSEQASRVWARSRLTTDGQYEIVVSNKSEGPIFDVHARLVVDGGTHREVDVGRFWVIHSGEARVTGVDRRTMAIAQAAAANWDESERAVEDLIVPVLFTDARGTPWKRTEFGDLEFDL